MKCIPLGETASEDAALIFISLCKRSLADLITYAQKIHSKVYYKVLLHFFAKRGSKYTPPFAC